MRLYRTALTGLLALVLASPAAALDAGTSHDFSGDANPALLERARPLVDAKKSVWAKTLVLRDTVRQFFPVGSGTCFDYAYAMVAVGQKLGLPLRLVAASLNGHNQFDTHTTAEVFLPALRKWVLADPTMAVHFTVGNRPVGAFEVRAMLQAGTWRKIRAQVSRVSTQRPEANYIDPRLYFRFVGVYGTINGKPDLVLPADSVSISNGVAVTDGDLARILPGASVPVVLPEREFTAARPELVPVEWYAPQPREWRPGDAVAVIVKAAQPVTVNGYETTWTVDGWLSPVHYAQRIDVVGQHEDVRVLVVGRMG